MLISADKVSLNRKFETKETHDNQLKAEVELTPIKRQRGDLASPLFASDNPNPIDVQCTKYLEKHDSSTLLDFLRVICLCHDVTKVTNQDGKSFLTGPSQDELCLMEMVAKTGIVEFIDRDSSSFKIRVQGKLETYKTIKFYDFTSSRKMMTRIVQNEQTGKVLVISKGADSAIISRCVSRRLY